MPPARFLGPDRDRWNLSAFCQQQRIIPRLFHPKFLFSFEITSDLKQVHQILTHPLLYDLMVDDFMPDRQYFEVPAPGAITYVLVKRASEVLGLVLVIRRNQIHCELHVCLLPKYWGPAARRAAKAFFPWFWSSFPYRRAIGNVPGCNLAAVKFAERLGLERFGLNKGVFQKGGFLYDEHWFAIDRPVNA